MNRALPVLVGLSVVLIGALVWVTRPPSRPAPRGGALVGDAAVVAWSPGYRVSFFGVERLHPIRLDKADAAAEALRRRGLVLPDGFSVPGEPDRSDLLRVHTAAHLDALRDPVRLGAALELALPAWIPGGVLDRRVLGPFRRQTHGTLVAARGALEVGLGINLGGGFHHARPDLAHGFCVYADVPIAIAALRAEGFTGRVLILDTDAHQGDGNHAAFADDDSVFTVSLHQEGLFPNPRVAGDRDVELPAGTTDKAYRAVLEDVLEDLPRDVGLVVHVAGADVLRGDPLAGLQLSIAGLVQRDLMVAQWAWEHELPVLHLLAGGYGELAPEAQSASVTALVEAHARWLARDTP